MEFKDRLKAFTKKRKLKIKDLAEILEVNYTTAWRWLKGKRKPCYKSTQRLNEILESESK